VKESNVVGMPVEKQAREGQTGTHSGRMKRNGQRHAALGRRNSARNAQERQKTGRDRPQGKRKRAEKDSRGIYNRHRHIAGGRRGGQT